MCGGCCNDISYPMLEEYDFRRDTSTPDLPIHLKPSPRRSETTKRRASARCSATGAVRSGIIVLPCGAGKTLVGITAAATVKKSTLVFCTTGVAVDQWRRQFLHWSDAAQQVHLPVHFEREGQVCDGQRGADHNVQHGELCGQEERGGRRGHGAHHVAGVGTGDMPGSGYGGRSVQMWAGGTHRVVLRSSASAELLRVDSERVGLDATRLPVVQRGVAAVGRVWLADGRQLVCTPNHRLRVHGGRWVEARYLTTTDEVVIGVDSVIDQPSDDEAGWTLPSVSPARSQWTRRLLESAHSPSLASLAICWLMAVRTRVSVRLPQRSTDDGPRARQR